MNVLLISNYLPDQQESMLRYARLLERELASRGIAVSVVYPPALLTRLTGRSGAFGKWAAYIDKYVLAGSALRAKVRWADVVHVCDHSNSMYLKLAGAKPAVITCHDLLAVFAAEGRFAGVSVGGTGRLLQRWIADGLLHARHVLCVSHKTAEDMRELAAANHMASPSLSVVHHPLNWNYHPVPVATAHTLLARMGLAPGTPYVLHVGSNSWYKNRLAVVRIFASLRGHTAFAEAHLLLAGKPWDEDLTQAVAASGCEGVIHNAGEVSNDELRALYSAAALFLFPSREEGFGWPIREAQACGCLVATTNRGPMTEVAGSAAILIDPAEPAAAAAAIAAESARYPQLRAAGLANAATFTLDRSIEGLLAVYREAIRAGGGAA
jgi:glycosyltransferase involved in cell wall biosynthesis